MINKQDITAALLETIEDSHDFSDSIVKYFIQNGTMREKALRLLQEDTDITQLSKDELNREVDEYIEVLSDRLKEILLNKEEAVQLFDTKSDLHKYTQLANENLVEDIKDPVRSLINYHINSNHPDKLQALLTAFNYIDMEDENKRLTLTEEQYSTWLNSNPTKINSKQFEILYGINKRKQQELRSHLNDPLPSYQLQENGSHYYDRETVEKWLDNYKRQ